MRILAFESSAKAASVALLHEGALLGESYLNCGLTHSVTLLKLAQDLLAACDLTPADIDAVACAAGPGSFTGVRIGVAAAKGFAWARELPCFGVSTLEAMAWQGCGFDGAILCAMDARRAQVYCAAFESVGGELHRLSDDAALSLEDWQSLAKKIEKPKIMVGDGAQLCYNTFGKTLTDCRLAPESIRMQRASGVALAAWRQVSAGITADGTVLVPNYLRLSQAERERAERLQTTKECSNG